MELRAERAEDAEAISRLTETAFAGRAHSSGTEAGIVEALRAAGTMTLSLVAEEEERRVVGHVAFSPVDVEGGPTGWIALGPLSVLPARQRRGIGATLVREGLARCRAAGAAGCVVLGDPTYYGRFGFAPTGLRYAGAPPAFFMALSFGGEAPAGAVRFQPAFEA